MQVSYEQLDTEETLSLILEKLLTIYSGTIYLWPHGDLVRNFRKFFIKKGTEEIVKDKRSITVPLIIHALS